MVEIKVSRRESALVPKNCEHIAPMTMEITSVTTTQKTLAKGGVVNEHRIGLIGRVGEWVGDYVLNFLWDDDVMDCVRDKEFTGHTENWTGRLVTIQAKKNARGYVRWCVKPVKATVETVR